MVAKPFYLLRLQKYIKANQTFLKEKKYSLSLGNISEDFSANNIKKTRLNGWIYDFSVDYGAFDNSNSINVHKYLMKNII